MADYDDRRREPRIPFRSDCNLEIIAPQSHIGLGLMRSQTINITEHGLMVMVPGIRQDVVARWQEEVDTDRVILVQVNLTAFPGSPTLKGQIVWTHWLDMPEDGPVCQLGLLFQILSDDEIEALQAILAGVATQQEL